MEPPTALAQRIRQLREDIGLSQAQLARRAGVTPSYWAKVEAATPDTRTRRPSLPSVPVVRAMADALGTDRADLLEIAGYVEDAAVDRATRGPGEPPHWLDELQRLDPEVARQVEDLGQTALARAKQARGKVGNNT